MKDPGLVLVWVAGGIFSVVIWLLAFAGTLSVKQWVVERLVERGMVR